MSYLDRKKQYESWLATPNSAYDIAVCLHTPIRLRAQENGFDEHWLRKKLMRYFNELDRKLFKNQYRRHGVRLKRLAVLGYTDTVGWHAHICVATPSHISAEELMLKMNWLWLKHMQANRDHNSFGPYLFWAEPAKADYTRYAISNAKEDLVDHNGTAYGTIDFENCHF